jgi:quinol monooxygenase YgiN
MKGLLIYFEVVEGKQPQFEAAVEALVAQVRVHDPSYELYSLAKLRQSNVRYVMVERFANAEAQEAHRHYPYVIEAMPAIDACLAGTPVVEWLDFVS